MTETVRTDKTTYFPFILMDEGKFRSLFLSDQHMVARFHVFEERSSEGWSGNGYDWNSVAQVVVAEQLPELEEELEFDPEAGTFSASGSRSALERLGTAMVAVYRSEDLLRDLLSRAEID